MTPVDPLVPSHPKRERVLPRDGKFTPVQPVGYILTLNKHVVAEAGKDGIIARLETAKRLQQAFIEARPGLTVEVFGIFPVTS